MLPAILLIVSISYLLGSIPIGYLLVRLFRQQDIRSVGSGNIGATNVLRYGGKSLGAITFLLDVLKGSSAVLIGALLAEQRPTRLPALKHFRAFLINTHKAIALPNPRV